MPREEHILHPATGCDRLACGGKLKRLGQDVSETLEYVPASSKVVRAVRP